MFSGKQSALNAMAGRLECAYVLVLELLRSCVCSDVLHPWQRAPFFYVASRWVRCNKESVRAFMGTLGPCLLEVGLEIQAWTLYPKCGYFQGPEA